MKRKAALLSLSIALVLALSACGGRGTSSTGNTAPTDPPSVGNTVENPPAAADAPGKALVVYFSTPGVDGMDAVSRASANIDGDAIVGNTEHIANLVASSVDGDMFRVETVLTYPEEVDDLLEYAYGETQNHERPELATHIDNLDEYDTVFIGVPVWNYQMPMAMYSFFDEYDFSGKTIAVFTTHRGSGLSGIPDDIAELEPDATVLTDGYTVNGDKAFSITQDEISEWVSGLFGG